MGTYPTDLADYAEETEAAVEWYVSKYGCDPIDPSAALDAYIDECSEEKEYDL